MANETNTKRGISKGPPPETYTKRLFGTGLYGRHHSRRFEWISQKISALAGEKAIRVLEVGCFEAKVLGSIHVPVCRYVGFDAGWGGGLERARESFKEQKDFSFIQSNHPKDIAALTEKFDFAICMETLEHVDPALLEQYIKAFSERLDGHLLITVPNEKGLALLIKMIGARLFNVDRIYPYTAKEVFWGICGRLNRVARAEHKGFDYAKLVDLIRKYFSHVSVEGVSPVQRPLQLGLTIGIVASHKTSP